MSAWNYAGNLLNIKTIKLNKSNGYSANISDFIDGNSTVVPFFQINNLVGDSNPVSKIDLSYTIESGIFRLTGGIGKANIFNKNDVYIETNNSSWLTGVYGDTSLFHRIDNSTIRYVANFNNSMENMAIKWKGYFFDTKYSSGFDTVKIPHNRLQITIQIGGRVVYSNVSSGYIHTIFGLFFKYKNEGTIYLTIKDLDGNRVYVDGFEGVSNYTFVAEYSEKKNMEETTFTNYNENELELDVFLIKKSVV